MQEYLRRLLQDKARLKKWKKIMIALSCIVVVCTVYALSLPAQTLACDKEEHTHTAECYDENNELICEKEEHTHTDDCTKQEEVVEDEPETQNKDEQEAQVSEEETTTTTTETTTETTSQPFDLNLDANKDKIKDIKLTYTKGDVKQEVKQGESVDTPDNLSMEFHLTYDYIKVSELKSHGNKITYQLPKQFAVGKETKKDLLDGNQKFGVLHVSTTGLMTITYKQDYLNPFTGEDAKVNATVFASVQVKLSELTNGTTKINTPKGDIILNFGTDYIQRYGNVTVVKDCEKKEGSSDYIEYTLTVHAGEDGCNDVVVVDKFAEGQSLVTYEGITKDEKVLSTTQNDWNPYEEPTGTTPGKIYLTNKDNSEKKIPDKIDGNTTLTEPGSFVWTVGDMKPNENRTLKYYAKLKDTGGVLKVKNSQPITNKAIVYAKGNNNQVFKKDETEKTFDLKMNYTMEKSVIQKDGKNYTRDTDGNYIIKYKLLFTLNEPLNEESNFSLKDFGFWDYLTLTEGDLQKYVAYNRNSIELYEKKKGDTDYKKVESNKFDVYWANNSSGDYTKGWTGNETPYRFKVKGTATNPITINPGDSYYVTYSITVKPEVYAVKQSDSVDIRNNFKVNSKNASNADGYIDSRDNTVRLDDYKWVDKEVVKVAKNEPISMKGKLYDGNLNEETNVNDSLRTFDVPANSYKYTVKVNQTHGIWDVRSATLSDSFSSEEMEYIGYAKITSKNEVTGGDGGTTSWVKIDGKTSFDIVLNKIGFTDPKYSKHYYIIEYYAKPKNLEMVSKVNVRNTFSLNGKITKGTETSKFITVNSYADVTLQGSYNIGAFKSAWYYEKPKENATYWRNGKLYWVIEVTGSGIKNGTEIIDRISSDNGLEDSFLHESSNAEDEDSIVGIFFGNKNPNEYKSIEKYKEEFQSQNISKLFDVQYNAGKFEGKNVGQNNFGELKLTAKKDVNIPENKKMYVVIQTMPCNLPNQYRETRTCRNELYKKFSEGNEELVNKADQTLYCGGNILKELGQVFTYDGTKVVTDRSAGGQDLKGNDPESKICKELLKDTGSGDYVSWAFKLNYSGELNGSYRVLEKIPEGMNLAYVRVKWRGSEAYQNVNSKEISGLDTTWQRRENTCDGDGDLNKNIKTIYYVKDKQVLLQLGDFNERKVKDNESVDVQVVCKVTAPEALLGNGREFVNSVTLQTEDGKKDIDTASSAVTVRSSSLSKFGNSIPKDSKINYEIIANPLGQTLSSDSTNLTLIDELGENLILDPTSIHAIRTDTNTKIEINRKIDRNKIEFEIPDNTPVKITYTTLVNVQPNTPIKVKNDVYWKSYKVSKIEKSIDFTYTVDAGGSGSVSNNPELKLYKFDSNVSKPLSGVRLQVSECQLQDGQITTTNESTEVYSTDSVLTLQSSQFTMNYNTIYEVKEIETVDGYNLDQTPYYIMYAKASSDNNYPDIVNQFNEYKNKQSDKDRFKIVYTSAAFRLDIPNEQKGITVKKQFTNNAAETDTRPVSGTYKFGLYGNAEGTGDPLQTIDIKYGPNDTGVKSAKFRNPDDLDGTYYVFELDQNNQPISASSEANINSMQYKVVYESNSKATNIVNAAKVGDTVTVTNKSRTKILPSTGGTGNLIYRMSGTALVVVGVISLSNIDKKRERRK